MEEFLGSVAASGFPIAVAVYLLVRMETELRSLREAIETLKRCSHCKYSNGGDEVS